MVKNYALGDNAAPHTPGKMAVSYEICPLFTCSLLLGSIKKFEGGEIFNGDNFLWRERVSGGEISKGDLTLLLEILFICVTC